LPEIDGGAQGVFFHTTHRLILAIVTVRSFSTEYAIS